LGQGGILAQKFGIRFVSHAACLALCTAYVIPACYSLGIQPIGNSRKAMTRHIQGWMLAGAAMLFAPALAFAQDTSSPQDIGTSTPPELRDFRLDTPPPQQTPQQAQPQPESTTAVPPAAERQQPPPEQRAVRDPQSRQPDAQADRRSQTVTDTVAAQTPLQDRPESVSDAVPSVDADSQPRAERAPVVAGDSLSEAQLPDRLWIGAVIAALLAALAFALWMRRRKLKARAEQTAELPKLQPTPPARLEMPKSPVSRMPVRLQP
jgi:hypothetical protein